MNKIISFWFRTYRVSNKAYWMPSLNVHELIIGKQLGDAHAEKRSNLHNTRIQFKQSESLKEYIDYMWDIIGDYCSAKPIKLSVSNAHLPGRTPTSNAYMFKTQSLPCFNHYRKLFYNEAGIKEISINISPHITAKTLAYFYQDDGYKAPGGFHFCTESYTEKDHEVLIQILKNRLGLNATKRKHGKSYRQFILESKNPQFVEIVKPQQAAYLPIFYYKLKDSKSE